MGDSRPGRRPDLQHLLDRITELEELIEEQDREIYHLKVFSMAVYNVLKEIYSEDEDFDFDRQFASIYRDCKDAIDNDDEGEDDAAWQEAMDRLISDIQKGRTDSAP